MFAQTSILRDGACSSAPFNFAYPRQNLATKSSTTKSSTVLLAPRNLVKMVEMVALLSHGAYLCGV